MHESNTISYSDKQSFYRELGLELEGILESTWFTNLSNFSALLFQHLPQINWVGFYLSVETELVLGPFQGKPACLRIPLGKGVCGTAVVRREIVIVPDVHAFPGHIACDVNSKSEIVLPLTQGPRLLGVLDIDAPVLNRFTQDDAHGLQSLIEILILKTTWPSRF